jgi:hypothetical protein
MADRLWNLLGAFQKAASHPQAQAMTSGARWRFAPHTRGARALLRQRTSMARLANGVDRADFLSHTMNRTDFLSRAMICLLTMKKIRVNMCELKRHPDQSDSKSKSL